VAADAAKLAELRAEYESCSAGAERDSEQCAEANVRVQQQQQASEQMQVAMAKWQSTPLTVQVCCDPRSPTPIAHQSHTHYM